MKLKIESREDKPLVDRYELKVKIDDVEVTPSNDYVKKEISKLMGKAEEVVIVKRILQEYGEKEAEALVYVYESPEALKKFEAKKKEKKEAAGTGAAPAQAPVEKKE